MFKTKKIISLLLAVLILISCSAVAFANDQTTYAITLQSLGGGMVESLPALRAAPGQVVTLLATPLNGYTFYAWASLSNIAFVNQESYITSFVMPAHDVIITASFYPVATDTTPEPDNAPIAPAPDETPSVISPAPTPEKTAPFNDVASGDWFYDNVMFVYEKGLMNGVSDKTFAPKLTTTRGMIVTILHRMIGSPEVSGNSSFDDVDANKYYADAINWASENGIVGGYGNGKFGPDDAITREQFASILHRFAKYKNLDVSVGEDTNILSYEDSFEVSEYAIPAFQWACGSNIISGNNGKLLPKGNATRAEVAAMLNRFYNAYMMYL